MICKMKTTCIKYKIKTATENEILLHLMNCSNSFIPPLAQRVNLKQYAQKLFEKSVTLEAWEDQLLVGFIAVYFNIDGSAFITNMSVLKEFGGYGIATRLMDICIEQVRKNNLREITLEVNMYNIVAIRLYKKFSFTVINTYGETLVMRRQI